MIAAIATIAEKVNEDRGGLGLTTSFAPFVKFNMAAVNRRLLFGASFIFYLCVFFNVEDDGKDKEPIDFGFEGSFRREKDLGAYHTLVRELQFNDR